MLIVIFGVVVVICVFLFYIVVLCMLYFFDMGSEGREVIDIEEE